MQHIAINPNLKTGDELQRGQNTGTIENYPNPISTRFQTEYEDALKAYEARDFQTALKILAPLVREEPNNRFFLNWYAKTLYALKAYAPSFLVYESLHALTDSAETYDKFGSLDVAVIDVWFLESYWKVGAMNLDRGQFDKAYTNIRKMLDVMYLSTGKFKPTEREFVVTALGYLTEATHALKQVKENHFFYCETLKVDPGNRYVNRFLLDEDQISPIKP